MVDRKKWKSLNLDDSTMQMLSAMCKGLNISKAGLTRLLLRELFDLFLLYKPFDCNIHFESSIYPMSQMVITFSGKRNLTVGKTSEEAITETLLEIKGEKEDD